MFTTEQLITRHWNATRTMLHRERGRPDRAMRIPKAAGHLRRVVELTGHDARSVMRDMQLSLIDQRLIERELRKK